MPHDAKLFIIQESIALQPDAMKLTGPELEISPVRLQRNGLAGEITFRAPPGLGLDQIIPILVEMLKNTPHGITQIKAISQS